MYECDTTIRSNIHGGFCLCCSQMGSFISYLWWGFQDPDEVDPISGISVRDIYYVRKSWTKVSADGVGSGTELLVR